MLHSWIALCSSRVSEKIAWLGRIAFLKRRDLLAFSGPSAGRSLRTVLRKLDLPKDGAFIDFGAGKGHVLLIAAQSGFQRIVGVEFSRFASSTTTQRKNT